MYAYFKSHLISTASEERSAEYLQTFYGLLYKELPKTKSFVNTPGLSTLIGQSMVLFQRHWDFLSQTLKHGKSTFMDLRQTHFDILLRDLHTYEKEWNGIIHVPSDAERRIFELGIILDSLIEYADLLCARPLGTTCKHSSLHKLLHAYQSNLSVATLWLDTLDESSGRTLSENVESSKSSVQQDTITQNMEPLLAKTDRLNASVGQRGPISSKRLHQVIHLLESCKILKSQ